MAEMNILIWKVERQSGRKTLFQSKMEQTNKQKPDGVFKLGN